MNYVVDISITGLDETQKYFDRYKRLIKDRAFRQFIADKCEKELYNICLLNLNIDEEQVKDSNYMSSMHTEIDKDYIYIYNDSEIDVQNKPYMKETTKEKYPAKLSLAKIVEYDIGYVGKQTPNVMELENWEYDIEGHGTKGWYYRDDNGGYHWTKGFQGRLIFYKLKEYIEQNISQWIYEYIDKI